MVRRMDHDASWTRLFSHDFVAAQLVRLALPELAGRLDLSTLKPLHTRWARSRPPRPAAGDDGSRKLRAAGAYALRTGDQAWRVRHADDAGRSLVLPVEYQSSPDSRMGRRSLEYALLAHEMESRRGPDADGWLRVLPLVLYSGGARWARNDPPWAVRRVQVSSDGQPMLPLGAAALLLDADSHGSDDSGPANVVASLLSLNVAPDWEAMQAGLADLASTLRGALPPERAAPLIDDLVDWVSVCQPQLSAELLDETRRSLKREEEPKMMALARMGIEYPPKAARGGRAGASGAARGAEVRRRGGTSARGVPCECGCDPLGGGGRLDHRLQHRRGTDRPRIGRRKRPLSRAAPHWWETAMAPSNAAVWNDARRTSDQAPFRRTPSLEGAVHGRRTDRAVVQGTCGHLGALHQC